MTKTDFSPMKKIFALAGLMTAAVISLTNCQPKELGTDEPIIGKTFTISASLNADTKTTADGMSTLWAEGDKINLFYGSSYTSLGEVVLSAGAGTKQGTFEASGAPSGSVTWYAIYPYSSKLETPATQTASYTYIGHSKGLNQDGWDNTGALCGSVCPLYGIAEGVAGEVNIPMKHLASAIELNLTNNTGSEIVVNSVTVTGSEDIVGSYYIAFASGTPEYVPSGANYVKNAATVNIEDSTLGKGESGKAYLAVKPYTQSESEPFKVTVAATIGGKEKTAEIELNPTGAQCVFTAGKMKKVNVPLSASDFAAVTYDTVSDAINGTVGDTYSIEEATVTLVAGNNVFATDNTGTVLLYISKNPYVVGDKISFSGATKAYNNTVEFQAPTVTKTGTGTVSLSPTTWSDSQMAAAYGGTAKIAYVSYTVTLDGSHQKGTIPGGNGAIVYLTKASGVSTSQNKTYTLTGYVYGWTDYEKDGVVTKEVMMYVDSATEVISEATLTVSPSSVSIDQAGGSAEATVTCDNNNWSIDTSTVPDWLTASKGSGKVSFSASANEGTKRNANVTLNHSNGSLTATVKVSQEGAQETEMLNLGAASISFTDEGGQKEVTVTCNASGDWSIDSSTVPSWFTATADKTNQKIVIVAQANTGEARQATIEVNHSNGEITRNLTVNQSAASSGNTATFTKVTSQSQLTAGTYLIVCTYTYTEDGVEKTKSVAMDGSLPKLDAEGNRREVTVSSNKIVASTDIAFTYDPSQGSFLSASGKYLANTADKNQILDVSEWKDDYAVTVTISSGDADIQASLPEGNGTHLRFNSATTNGNRYRFFKNASYQNQQPIQLYKKQ